MLIQLVKAGVRLFVCEKLNSEGIHIMEGSENLMDECLFRIKSLSM